MRVFLVIRTQEIESIITKNNAFFDANGLCISDLFSQENAEFNLAFARAAHAAFTEDACVIFLNAANDTICGWYRHAKLYAHPQEHLPSNREYLACSDIENVFLLAEGHQSLFSAELPSFKEFVFLSEPFAAQVEEQLDGLQKTAPFVSLRLDISKPTDRVDAGMKKLSEAYFDTGDTVLLPKVYQNALKYSTENPKEADPWDYMGFALLELARPQEALTCFEKALQLDPLHKSAVRDKGECLIRLGQFDKAVRWLNEAVERIPTDDIRIQLSDAYLFAGFPGISFRILKTIETAEMQAAVEPFLREQEADMPYLLSAKPDYSVPDAYPVFLDFKSSDLPECYVDASGMKRYLDPIRKKGIPVTPEETVRQRVIAYLLKQAGVPAEALLVEESLAHIDRDLRERVDILARATQGGKQKPILLVECKAPGIVLDGEPTAQLLRYNTVLAAPFVLLTNGDESRLYHFSRANGEYKALRELPSYEKMCEEEGIKYVQLPISAWMRPDYAALSQQDVIAKYVRDGNVGEGSSLELKPSMLNLAFCLLDEKNKIECPLSVPGCTIETDYGVIPMTTGNAGGGSFSGNYRWLGVIDRHGRRQNVYLAVFGMERTEDDGFGAKRAGATTLYFAVEEKGHAVSRLQIRLDSCLKPDGDGYRLTHTGVRSRGKIQPLLDFIGAQVPELLGTTERIVCGHLDTTKNLYLSDRETAQTIGRAVSYLLLRSELRELEKTHRGRA